MRTATRHTRLDAHETTSFFLFAIQSCLLYGMYVRTRTCSGVITLKRVVAMSVGGCTVLYNVAIVSDHEILIVLLPYSIPPPKTFVKAG